jgi:hypothetical protein
MSKLIKHFTIGLAIILMTAGFSRADSQPPQVGGVLPEVVLPAPPSVEHQQYLGIEGKNSFSIPEIRAEIVIIEIFNIY